MKKRDVIKCGRFPETSTDHAFGKTFFGIEQLSISVKIDGYLVYNKTDEC